MNNTPPLSLSLTIRIERRVENDEPLVVKTPPKVRKKLSTLFYTIVAIIGMVALIMVSHIH